MEHIKGQTREVIDTVEMIREKIGSMIHLDGVVHKIRLMSDFAFVVIRLDRDLVQCIYSEKWSRFSLDDVREECAVTIEGEVVAEERSTNGFEIYIHKLEVLSSPAETLPVVINTKKLVINLDTNLNYRSISLRNPHERAVFKIQEGISRGFREFLIKQKFTEIRTPKIVFAGAEGGANIFRLDYFDKEVFLAQSPQFYKQAMVGVFGRVFEIAPVYRAEKHSTSRHLNEYISMDLEMGFIDSFVDIMDMETALLKHLFNLLKAEYSKELKLMGATVPEIDSIPVIKFMQAKEIITEVYKKKITDFHDFEPEEEQLICDYMKKNFGSEFVFVTHYPSVKRPFYAMDDPEDPEYTLSFDLLFRGTEVTTGGQRIHSYREQVDKMVRRGMNPEDFESYLMVHKHGMPPHGGLGAGLERLTMKLLGLANIRNACLYPRDTNRVTP